MDSMVEKSKKKKKKIRFIKKKVAGNAEQQLALIADTALANNNENNPDPPQLSYNSNVPLHIQHGSYEYVPVENTHIYHHKSINDSLVQKGVDKIAHTLKDVMPGAIGDVVDVTHNAASQYIGRDTKLMNKLADFTINQNLNRQHVDKEANKKFLYDVLKTAALSGGIGFGLGYFFPHSSFIGPALGLATEYAQGYILNRPVEKYRDKYT